MVDTRLILSGIWAALMLTYLWGDVLRLIAADGKPGAIFSTPPSQGMWIFMALLMMIPIVMIVLTLIMTAPAIRWINIIVAAFWVVFNLIGLSGYPIYDKLLLILSFGFNALTIWYAWNWVI